MIRHVVLIRFEAGVEPGRVEGIMSALKAMRGPGMTGYSIGTDLGLRPGNTDLAIVADFADEESFARYDADAEHNRIRRDLIAPIAASVERCQFRTG
jgi:hypothetical protein